MVIRQACPADLKRVAAIYDAIHTAEEAGQCTTGWVRGVYPTLQTAEAALARGDLFVGEAKGKLVGSAIINQHQTDAYTSGPWQHPAPDNEVMVLHTLTIDPSVSRRGYGRAFVKFYEDYALANGCRYLRMDTNARNARARAIYKRLGYDEIAIVPCCFNGIEGVPLVLLEKKL
ncbi:MAG: GNAT family N-acetyltransferase [Clostridia bacterium]|nr:GNAT family N-acetyltransferase [Clostridia bacterium]